MARISALLTAFVSLSVVFANPIVQVRENPITVPIVARINATGARNFVESQRARAQQLMAIGRERAAAREARANGDNTKRAVVNVPVTNAVVSSYLKRIINHLSLSLRYPGDLYGFGWRGFPCYSVYEASLIWYSEDHRLTCVPFRCPSR